MKKKNEKIYLNCGYESNCKHKDCINCPRKRKYKFNLSLAEEIGIEDFAVCDIESMVNGGEISEGFKFPDKKKELELMQNIMMKLMSRMFKQQHD